MRDYGVEGQIGLEPTLDEYLNKLLAITGELKRVLKPTGVMFWNHGDCYSASGGAGLQAKCMVVQNYRLILQMIGQQGWILRNTIVWHKPNHMPSSVKDRFANSYEPVFMLVKKKKYWFDLDAVRVKQKEATFERAKYGEGKWNVKDMTVNSSGKNPGDVWKIPTQPFPEAHFATFPEKLVLPMIKSSCPKQICKKCEKARERITRREDKYTPVGVGSKKGEKRQRGNGYYRPNSKETGGMPLSLRQTIGWTNCGCNAGWRSGVVLDPFMGAGTTAAVANKLKRDWIGIELSEEYIKIAKKRIKANPKPMI